MGCYARTTLSSTLETKRKRYAYIRGWWCSWRQRLCGDSVFRSVPRAQVSSWDVMSCSVRSLALVVRPFVRFLLRCPICVHRCWTAWIARSLPGSCLRTSDAIIMATQSTNTHTTRTVCTTNTHTNTHKQNTDENAAACRQFDGIELNERQRFMETYEWARCTYLESVFFVFRRL